MPDAFVLFAAFVASVAGMGWFAMSFDVHSRQVSGDMPRSPAMAKTLRALGTTAVTVSLALCLSVDHVSMASLVWVTSLAAAALVIAFTLTWRARWLRWLAPWM